MYCERFVRTVPLASNQGGHSILYVVGGPNFMAVCDKSLLESLRTRYNIGKSLPRIEEVVVLVVLESRRVW